MKHFSEQSGPPIVSPQNGFWVCKDRIYDVTNSTHALFIMSHLALFQLTTDIVRDTYNRHHETVGTEGRAREELIKLVASKGWVRVRHYSKPTEYWTIQCDGTEKRKETIREFIEWALSDRIMNETDAAVILGFDNPRDRHKYSWESGGVGAYLTSGKDRNPS